MQVAKWGNSLAIRLPKAIVDALELREGDDVQITIAGSRRLEVEKDRGREEAVERLKAMRLPLPKGFRFDRDEAHER